MRLVEGARLVLGRAAVCQITRIELLGFGGLTEAEELATRRFLGSCGVLLLSETVEAETIRLRRLTRLKLPDAIVLATARVAGASLLTLDLRLSNAALSLNA